MPSETDRSETADGCADSYYSFKCNISRNENVTRWIKKTQVICGRYRLRSNEATHLW